MLKKIFLLAATAALLSTGAYASDGVIEINHACATSTGCFPGDSAGYPILISASSPSNYRLTSDLTLPNANTNAIAIVGTKSNVSIDLGGFAIIGPNSCIAPSSSVSVQCTQTSGGSGIRAFYTNAVNVSVQNGSIRGMGSAGIDIAGQGALVRNMRVEDCGGGGVVLRDASVVENVAVSRTGGFGLSLIDYATVRHSTAKWNVTGFSVGIGGKVEGSTSSRNFRSGFIGAASSNFQGNTSNTNGEHGIFVTGGGAVVKGNTVRQNGLGGILVQSTSVIESNSVIDSGTNGIASGSASVVSGNTIAGSGADGITAAEGTTIRGNTVFDNGSSAADDGIHCSLGCTVQGNSLRSNAGYGLRFDSQSSVYTENAIGANGAGTVVNGRDGGSNVCETTLGCP